MKTNKKFDAAPMLGLLAELRRTIPFIEQNAPRRTRESGFVPQTPDEFEYAAVADGLETLADDLAAAIAKRRAAATEAALEVYYKAEELSRDPAHADLIPLVARMREAYEHDHGRPIPPKAT